jgi:hypothetical protein
MKNTTNRNSYRRLTVILAAASLVLLISSLSPAAVIPVFKCDFEGGPVPEISGAGQIVGTQGFGPFGLDNYFLQNLTGGDPEQGIDGDPTVLTLSGLPFHTHIEIRMDLAFIDSWDAADPSDCGPDYFNVTVDSQVAFRETFSHWGGPEQSFAPEPEQIIVEQQKLFLNPGTDWIDSLYAMGPSLKNIPHSGSGLTITFHADGDGWQGGNDESWGIDNIEIFLIIEVDIDIKPGSDPNPINPGSNGLIPVAILSSPEFAARQVDPTSVTLAGASVAVRGKGKSMAHEEDVNGDGLVDLVVQVETQGLDDLGTGGTVKLTGTTFNGEAIVGYDEVVIVSTKEVITSVVRDGVTEGQPEIVAGPSPGGLQEGAHAYMDRPIDNDDTRNYHWENIPSELVGADYVMTYNEDKRPVYNPKVYNVSYAVTLGQAANLYILVDDRYAPFTWLTDGSSGAVFEDTGLDIMLNEVGGRDVLQHFDVYGTKVPAGTYTLGPSCDGKGSRNFYSIVADK